jgi:hypothetical protein
MMALAAIAFLSGVPCAFVLRLLAFGLAVLAAVGLAAALAALGFGFGTGPGMAALTVAVAMQIGYVAGIALRTVIAPFSANRANERGAEAAAGFSRL